MGKKREQGTGKREEATEKVITGSGADVKQIEYDQGMVKCKCIVPCVWRGYRDEGDTVWIKKEMIEKDAFIRMHFEEVKSEELRVKSSDNADGADGNENAESDNGNAESDNADGGSDNADSADGNGEGQGELGLK